MTLLPAETGAVCRPRRSYPRAAEASRAKAARWDVRHRIKLGEGRGTPEYPRPSCYGGAKPGSTQRRKGVLALSARYAEWLGREVVQLRSDIFRRHPSTGRVESVLTAECPDFSACYM